MTTDLFPIPVRSLLMTAGVLLTMANCGTSHVGETWQCPLTQGARCTSVEAADPAVRPLARAIELPPLVLESFEPKPPAVAETESRDAGRVGSENQSANEAVAADRTISVPCRTSCNPLGWLLGWLTGGDSPDSETGEVGKEAETDKAVTDRTDAVPLPPPVSTRPENAAAEIESGTKPPITSHADVRIPEKIGRVWIAPWVDGNDVYREGAWVRIVISAATWRRF